MPNHVTSIIKLCGLNGNALTEARRAFVNGDGLVDFDVLIPTPECLKDFEPHMGIVERARMALGLFADPNATANDISGLTDRIAFGNALRAMIDPARPEDIPLLARAVQNYGECGYIYWYDWRNDNWGTKWGAYDQPEKGWPEGVSEFKFNTAWSHPSKIISLISKRLPEVIIEVKYADEDLGSNCGSYKIKNGHRFDDEIAPASSSQTIDEKRHFTEFAFRIVHGNDDPASLGYDKNWQYSEEVYEAFEAANG